MVRQLVKIYVRQLHSIVQSDILSNLETVFVVGDGANILHCSAVELWNEYLIKLVEGIRHAKQFLVQLHACLRNEEMLIDEFLAHLLDY